MDNNILPEFDLDKTANTLGDEIAKMVIEKLIKQDALVPVVHAKWIPVTNSRGGHKCSLCNSYAPSCKSGDELLSNYCPNCGARMDEDINKIAVLPSAESERKWTPCSNPPKHHRDVLVRGIEAIGNVTVHKVMQWDVDRWRPTDYAPSIFWKEWSEI